VLQLFIMLTAALCRYIASQLWQPVIHNSNGSASIQQQSDWQHTTRMGPAQHEPLVCT